MTGMEYREEYDESYIKELCTKLHENGAKKVLITGVGFRPGKTGVYLYDGDADEYDYYENDRIDASYHGTGDIFASSFTGALTLGLPMHKAMQIAADYTAKCIDNTVKANDKALWYGVNFEAEIPYLLELIK